MAMSHANCTHPRTPAGRRACRAGNVIPAMEITGVNAIYARANDDAAKRRDRVAKLQDKLEAMADEPVRLTGAQARKIAKHAAKSERIQPRRSGARVAIDNSGCVQAALHTGRGRCACGWDTITATRAA